MKLYAKIKVNGKWTMVPAGSIDERLEALDICECRVCCPWPDRQELMEE